MIGTPTLRSLDDSAPYLHHGRAPTLYELLTTHNAADEHGVTSNLTDAELQDLRLSIGTAVTHLQCASGNRREA